MTRKREGGGGRIDGVLVLGTPTKRPVFSLRHHYLQLFSDWSEGARIQVARSRAATTLFYYSAAPLEEIARIHGGHGRGRRDGGKNWRDVERRAREKVARFIRLSGKFRRYVPRYTV